MTPAGASAALAGLVFVALSVNIAHILQYSNLPSRAAATIGSLILILVSSMAALIHQPMQVLGIEILIFGLGAVRCNSCRLGRDLPHPLPSVQ